MTHLQSTTAQTAHEGTLNFSCSLSRFRQEQERSPSSFSTFLSSSILAHVCLLETSSLLSTNFFRSLFLQHPATTTGGHVVPIAKQHRICQHKGFSNTYNSSPSAFTTLLMLKRNCYTSRQQCILSVFCTSACRLLRGLTLDFSIINRPLDRCYLQVIFYNSNVRAFQSTDQVINIAWNRQVSQSEYTELRHTTCLFIVSLAIDTFCL